MNYKTLMYQPNRLVPRRNINMNLEKAAVFESILYFGFFIHEGFAFGSSGPEGLYVIDLKKLHHEKFLGGEQCSGSLLLADGEKFIVQSADTRETYSVDFVNHKIININLSGDVYTSKLNLSLGQDYLVLARSDARQSVMRLNNKFELAKEYKLGFSCSCFALDDTGQRILIHGKAGDLVCFDIENASEVWRKGLNDLGVLPSPEGMRSVNSYVHAYRNLAIAATANLHVLAVDIDAGEVVWRRRLDGDVNFPCVDWRGRIYKVSSNCLIIMDSLSGELIAKKPVLVKGDLKDKGVCLDTAFCDVTETHFFGITMKGFLYAVNLDTGELDWFDDTGEMYQMGRPFVIHGNRLYLQTVLSNKLVVYEGQGGYCPDS